MWGKAPFHRTRKPSGETPLPEDTRVYQSPPYVAQNRNLSAKALPTLPSYTQPTKPLRLLCGLDTDGHSSSPPESYFTAHHPEHNPRVASSVYSRDTAVFDHHRQRSISDTYRFPPQLNPQSSDDAPTQGTRGVDISPPDSPIDLIHSRGSSRVSPIEDEPIQSTDTTGVGGKFSSQIPIVRKRVDSQPEQRTPKPSPRANATRWDDFSGESTTSNKGKIGQVTPSSISFETHISARPPPSSTSSKILGWGKEQLRSGRKAHESRSRYYYEASPFVPQEPWRGQSGRSAMINPIQERPTQSSSRLRGSSNDQSRETNTLYPSAGVWSGTVTTTITAGGQNYRQQPQTKPYDAHAAETATKNASSSAVSGSAPPRVDLGSEPRLSINLNDLTLSDDDLNEPTSRFSVTTYEPSEAGSSTPNQRHSITPSPPASISETASQSSETARSVMSRSRPVPSGIAPGKPPLRKPTPSEIPSSKALPPNPAEMSAQDRIEMLEAKRDDLARRRTNINTIIHELTQVIQPSSVAYDMAAREEVKKTVGSLNNELAEIRKDEHEIGLKILRAWKKREKEDVYEQSTSLWVKRVTR